MSFSGETFKGRGYEAGYFLVDNEHCTRLTKTISHEHAQVVTRPDGTKIVPAGAIYPANGSSATGIVYEDIDVTDGDMPGSVVTEGIVYTGRLPAAPVADAVTALSKITFVATAPAITRPNFES